jgi:hypothetical protein|tara:strand:- start:137 stop:553 length:417 start_codon:yes stop_codon:yes gene_type:complete
MATRATISIAKREEGVSFSEKPNKTIVDIYHHYDGYPEGLGVKLASYLDDYHIVNGAGREGDTLFNGIGCMAASIIAHLKDGPGNVYIEDKDSPHGWLDYNYYVWGDYYKSIWISIFDGDECIFVGKPRALLSKYYTN